MNIKRLTVMLVSIRCMSQDNRKCLVFLINIVDSYRTKRLQSSNLDFKTIKKGQRSWSWFQVKASLLHLVFSLQPVMLSKPKIKKEEKN